MIKSAFTLGILAGIAGTFALWPDPEKPENVAPSVVVAPPVIFPEAISSRSLSDLLADCQKPKSPREALEAYQRLSSSAQGRFPEALELIDWEDSGRKVKIEALALLLAWSEKDPEAALEWSWKKLRASSKWEVVCGEIFESWIARGDHAVLDFLAGLEMRENALTEEEAAGDQPLSLRRAQMDTILEWIYFYDGDLARASLDKKFPRSLIVPIPANFIDRLNSHEEVTAALEMWPDTQEEFVMRELMKKRGRELGMEIPNVFKKQKSAFTDQRTRALSDLASMQGSFWRAARHDLSDALERAAKLDGSSREAAYLAMYDSWALANPGEAPDYDALPAEARDLWKDLSQLGPVDDSYNGSFFHPE